MKRKKRNKAGLSRIQVPYGAGRKLQKQFECSGGYVSDSLSGHLKTELAKEIRKAALTQYEGVEMKPIRENRQKNN